MYEVRILLLDGKRTRGGGETELDTIIPYSVGLSDSLGWSVN